MTDLSFEALRPEYESLWTRVIAPGGITKPVDARRQALAIAAAEAKAHYQAVEKKTGVPWFVTGIIHIREAGIIEYTGKPNFETWLHNGDPMFDRHGNPTRTRHVPAGRPPNPRCDWEEGAKDAFECEGLIGLKDWSPARVAFILEKYNGFGYRLYHHIRSPYLWGGTVVQQHGKYTKDKEFDSGVMDPQIGGMALLAALMQLDDTAKFETKEKSA